MAEPTHQEPEGDVADANALVPDKLGFMCGIEVHQQLATGKLHSRQPGTLYDVTIDTIPKRLAKIPKKIACGPRRRRANRHCR